MKYRNCMDHEKVHEAPKVILWTSPTKIGLHLVFNVLIYAVEATIHNIPWKSLYSTTIQPF